MHLERETSTGGGNYVIWEQNGGKVCVHFHLETSEVVMCEKERDPSCLNTRLPLQKNMKSCQNPPLLEA